jgi:hypothetical protein
MKALMSAFARELLRAGVDITKPFTWKGVTYTPKTVPKAGAAGK